MTPGTVLGVHVLPLAALLDPTTPPGVLQAIATAPRNGASHYLLAHPNTPPELLGGLRTRSAAHLTKSLSSPALTSSTRARVLDATSSGVLLEASHEKYADHHAHVIAALAARLHRPRERCRTDIAAALFDHAFVDDATHLAALKVAVTTDEVMSIFHRGPDAGGAILAAAARHPQHLRELAAIATPTQAPGLLELANLADAGTHPYLHHLASARSSIPADRGSLDVWSESERSQALATAIATCPDATLADELLTANPTLGRLAQVILDQPALVGTRAWYRAWEGRGGGAIDPPIPTIPSSTDPFVIDAAVCRRRIDLWVHQPLGAPAHRLAALASALEANPPQLDSTWPWLVHAARIGLHPATDPATGARIGRSVLRLFDAWAARTAPNEQDPRGQDASLHLAARLAASRPTPEPVLTATPVAALNMAGTLPAIDEYLAHHCIPLLRALPRHAQQTALRLQATFAGTLGELLATATAIAAR